MSTRLHYTVRAKSDNEIAQDEDDARGKLRRELEAHYDETWSIVVQRRNPSTSRWDDVSTIDVLHSESEPVELGDVPKAQRIDELAEDLVAMAEGEAVAEGPTRVRVVGRPERKGKPSLFDVPWIAGAPLLPSETKLHAADANVVALTSTVRALESAQRLLERTWRANTSMAEGAGKYHDNAVGTVNKVLEMLAKIEGPTVERARITLEQQTKRAEHEASMAEDAGNQELLMEALGLLGKALDADRRDRKEDRDADKRARGKGGAKVVDTTAREASDDASSSSSDDESEDPGPSPVRSRPSVDRCAEARELAELLDELDEKQLAKIAKTLTADELAAIVACADTATRDDFDRKFQTVDALWQKRGQAGVSALQTEIASVIGLRAFTLKKIATQWERRVHGRPGGA